MISAIHVKYLRDYKSIYNAKNAKSANTLTEKNLPTKVKPDNTGVNMCLDIGHDFYCAHQNAFVAKSEFNSVGSFYHEPKNGVPYVARGVDECKCLTCPATDKTKCGECKQPSLLKMERTEALSKMLTDAAILWALGFGCCPGVHSVWRNTKCAVY